MPTLMVLFGIIRGDAMSKAEMSSVASEARFNATNICGVCGLSGRCSRMHCRLVVIDGNYRTRANQCCRCPASPGDPDLWRSAGAGGCLRE